MTAKFRITIINISDPGFVCIATHEIGHALGLDHSEDEDAVMHVDYPCSGQRDVTLDDDDIKGIRVGYVKKIKINNLREEKKT